MKRLLALALAFGLLGGAPAAMAQVGAANYQTALEFYKLGEWATAERILVELLVHAPNHHQARWTLASLYFRTSRETQARKLFAEIANREGGELARHAKAWLDANPLYEANAPFSPNASGSISLAAPEAGFQLAEFPTAPLSLRIPDGYELQSSQVERKNRLIHATYRFAPKAAPGLGIALEIVTLPNPEDASIHRITMIRELLADEGLNRNLPFRENEQLVHGRLAHVLGYTDARSPQLQVLAIGVASERYRVILRATCPDALSREHFPKLQGTLGSLRLR